MKIKAKIKSRIGQPEECGCPIFYRILKNSFGYLLAGATSTGICWVGLDRDSKILLREFKKRFPRAMTSAKNQNLNKWMKQLLGYLAGKRPWPLLPYDVKATAFQKRVWDRLRTIPAGKTFNYQAVAQAIGNPQAARAVARACATNPVALVIPCHRIVPKSGGVGGYRWESARKEKLLRLEYRR